MKKIDELNTPPKDPNSPESQEFLRELHNHNLIRIEKLKK